MIAYAGGTEMLYGGERMPYSIEACLIMATGQQVMWTDGNDTMLLVVNDLHKAGLRLSNKGAMTFDVMRGTNSTVYYINVRINANATLKILCEHNIFPHTTQDSLVVTFGGNDRLETCWIVGASLDTMGITSPTAGSAAMADYRNLIGYGRYLRQFPNLPLWRTEIRQAYHGGVTFAKDGEYRDGVSYDCNSMYPWAARTHAMPYGEPLAYEGEYVEDGKHPYHIDLLTFRASVKQGCIPYAGMLFGDKTDMAEDTGGFITRWLTDEDVNTLSLYYNLRIIEHVKGYKFAVRKGMFSAFVDDWYGKKSVAQGAERELDKIMVNSFIGKFGAIPGTRRLMPQWDEDGNISWHIDTSDDSRTLSYPPVAMWTTAFARTKLLKAMHDNKSHLIYADTDSVILDTVDNPVGIEVSATKLGAWKVEHSFSRMRVLGVRKYAMRLDNDVVVNNLAGIPMSYVIDYDDFRSGTKHHNAAGGEFIL